MRRHCIGWCLALLLCGCSRAFYRNWADRDDYRATAERDQDPRWKILATNIDPPKESRLHDPFDPNYSPLPPDDPAAGEYMVMANGMRGWKKWHRNGDAPWIEDPSWRQYLPYDKEGKLYLTTEKAINLGLLNSREYQTALEQLYITSLALTLDRFEFALHWFGTNSTDFNHFGGGLTESNTLTTASHLGFNRALAAGGQFMIDFANSFVYQYRGQDSGFVNTNLLVNFIQPLLRNAGRQVRMETLTQGERNLLYAVRAFARFRKEYTFDVGTNRYLQLLLQEQTIRNLQSNLESLQQNYRLHQALFAGGNVSSVKVDQVYQSLLQARLALITATARLETDFDQYKRVLGMPPEIPVKLDDSRLSQFQLNEEALTALQGEVDKLLEGLRQLDPTAPLVKLEAALKRLNELRKRSNDLLAGIGKELKTWKKQKPEADADKVVLELEAQAKEGRTSDFQEIQDDLAKIEKKAAQLAAALGEANKKENLETLIGLAQDLSAAEAQMFVIQTQVRVYLIRLKPLKYDVDQATEFALDNRLDLMNQRGEVVDAWRQITVTASALEAGLDLVFNANIATPPGRERALDFRAISSSYNVGVRFDAPLNRYAARNNYRQAQIAYERQRRVFMGVEDEIRRAIRLDLRNLRTQRLNFEISRQSLIAAVRQVEQAREELLLQERSADPTSTQNILNALDNALQAKNALIGTWINYEISQYQLLLDLEALQIDDQGSYIDVYPDQPQRPAPASDQAPEQLPAPKSAESEQLPAPKPAGPENARRIAERVDAEKKK